jgi:hypothetical protein
MTTYPSTSSEVDKLMPALIAARKEIGAIGKDSAGRFKYASLPSIIGAVIPILLRHGLFLTQNEVQLDGDVLVLATEIFESSGQFIRSTTRINDPYFYEQKQTMSNIQNHGSTLTYLKRYAINNMLCLEIQEDDPDDTPRYVSEKVITDSQLRLLESKLKLKPDLQKPILTKLGIDELKNIPIARFNDILVWIDKQ